MSVSRDWPVPGAMEGVPESTSFIGAIREDASALRVAKADQDATDLHQCMPSLFL